jgi:SAM-dependent methyltransferase
MGSQLVDRFFYALIVLRRRGIFFLWTYFKESILFDLRHGTRTFARVPKNEQTIDIDDTQAADGLLYVASFTSVTAQTVELARNALGSEDFKRAQFLDLGCGKGKALLVFAKLFGAAQTHKAIGIDFDPDLVRLARANIARCSFAKGRVEVACDSAMNLLDYVQSDLLVVYIYNSFKGETLRGVLAAMRNIPHVLIYVDPAERHILPEYNYTILDENIGRYNADTWLVADHRGGSSHG